MGRTIQMHPSCNLNKALNGGCGIREKQVSAVRVFSLPITVML